MPQARRAWAARLVLGAGLGLGILSSAGPSAADLVARGNHYWHPNTPPLEEGSHFGWAVAAGDFDGDGYDDLAIGAPWEDVAQTRDLRNAGAVWVYYGSQYGMSNIGVQRLTPLEMGCIEAVERGSRFGAALAAGDFDADGYDDLAIGIPELSHGPTLGALGSGAVMPLYGGPSGLSLECTYLLQNRDGELDRELDDGHGASLASGDFDADGYADLAVGAPWETVSVKKANKRFAGAVNVFYGSSSGLEYAGSQLWHQDSPGIKGRAGVLDRFGQSLAAGDFAGDGADDLAIGVFWECLQSNFACGTGVVQVLMGRPGKGLGAKGNKIWSKNTPGIGGRARSGEQFGHALAAADFDGDGRDDLAIGVPRVRVRDRPRAGTVHVIYGADEGLTASRSEIWHQGGNLEDRAEAGDHFGASLAAGDFDGSGIADLVIGIPDEDLGGREDVGAVQVLYGRGSGLSASGNQFWSQRRAGVEGRAEANDAFGYCAAAGDFDGNGADDLAIGVPFEEMGGFEDAGAVHVLYGIPILRRPPADSPER